MLDGLTLKQFLIWQAYYELEPFGEQRADLRMAILGTVLGNLWISKGRKLKLKDLMPTFAKRKPKTWRQMKSLFKQFANAHNQREDQKNG